MANRTNRRKFLSLTAAAGVGYWAAGGVSLRESRAANESIHFASIGVGGKGSSDSADAGRSGDMVAICDIDENNLNKAARRFKGAKKFNDWRKMLDDMGKSIDAVTVSTPDHSHACASAAAMHLGKHCFTQKPLTHTIHEARVLGELAQKQKVATMMGNQGTANAGLRKGAALVQAGALGDVKEVHVWTNRPVWPQGEGRPTETPEVPGHIHWDLFLGPAPKRPFHPAYHPFKWRGWWDFGTGALGDMACHTLNLPFMALNLRDPVSVVAETSGHNQETYPSWSVITFKFPKSGDRGPVTLYWYDGGKRPSQGLIGDEKMSNSGSLMVGAKGSIYSPGDYGGTIKLLGGAEEKDVEIVKSPGHFTEWVNAIKTGKPAVSNFPDYAGPLTETILLGNLAVWADGKKIEWDAKNLVAKNAPEVMHIVKKEYPKGYSL